MVTKRLWIVLLLLGFGLTGRTAAAAAESWEQAAEESFWYSLYTVESLLLTSGMGAPLPLSALEQAGLSPSGGLFPVEAPFREALPRFARTPDPDRPETLRWSPGDMDQTISLDALAYAVIAELGWAARLEQLLASQSDSASLRREARLFALMAHASMEFAERKLLRPDGLYHEALRWWRELPLAEGPPPWRGQLAWLWALAAPAKLDPTPGPSEARDRAAALFRLLDERLPWETLTVREASLAVKALAWLLSAQPDPGLEARASRRVAELAERLGRLAGSETVQAPGDLGAVVSGLLYAYQLTGDVRYRRDALRAWARLLERWDDGLRLFLPGPRGAGFELTLAGVGELLHAFHAMISAAESEEEAKKVRRLYAEFFEGLKATGLQLAEGPEAGGELDGDPVPGIREAGAPPVPIAAVRYDPEAGWQVSDRRFLAAPALYAANAWLWLGRFRGEGFPTAGLPESPVAERVLLPRRLAALEEGLAGVQSELDRLNREISSLRAQTAVEAAKTAERLRRLEGALSALREELPPRLDEEALRSRLQEQIERRLAETIGPQIEGLTQNLKRLEKRLQGLEAAPSEDARLRGQVQNLIERLSALEEETERLRWPIRPEVLLGAIFLLGVALLVVGLLQLRFYRRRGRDSQT